MQLRLSRTGGFAGIQRPPIMVDTANLPAAEAKRCEELVRDAGFFERPRDRSPVRQPDRFEYTIEVFRPGGATQAVTFGEADAPDAWLELVRWIEQAARRRGSADAGEGLS